ncbi:MAG: aminotransferase IV [Phycisphaerae bacterium]|nr:aminotransferase IV [Phycisphaerae bacterium]|tara:strand:- start:197 stop:1096 length:900 start_codon:yes stop_codon:yes gene_type:complete
MLQTFDERNRDLMVNINGKLSHRDEAGVSPFDSTVQGGDAVWEGLRVYDGKIFRLERHLDRLRNSAEAVAFVDIPSHEEIISEIRRTLEANGMTDGVHIRLTLSRGLKLTSGMDPRLNTSGSTLIVLAEHKPPVYDKSGLKLKTSSIRRFSPDQLDQQIHSCNLLQSIMAKIEANAAGADDALMLDARGFIAETNATHLFFVHGEVVTTSQVIACPEGVTRSVVLELCERNGIASREGDFELDHAYSADEVFCTGTMGELAPVTEIDGRMIGEGDIGPMTMRLSGLFEECVRSEAEPVL